MNRLLNKFRSPIWGEDTIISATLADVLAEPAANEDALLDVVRKTDGDETVEEAAAVYARTYEAIVDAYGGELPAELQKAMRTSIGLASDPPPPVAKLPEPPKPKPRPAGESLAEIKKIAKDNERWFDERAERDIDDVARRVRKASGYTLTKEQSVAKALKDNPELYAGYHRHSLRKMGVLDDRPSVIAKAEDEQQAFERRVAEILEREPELSRLDAVLKATKEGANQ